MNRQQVVLVCGPPCSGKTTFVRTNAGPEDMIVDYDDIRQALSGSRYQANPAVDAKAAELWAAQLEVRHPGTTWLVWAAPTRGQRAMMRRRFDCQVLLMRAGLDECLERARAERPPTYQQAIVRWFQTWQPSTSHPEKLVALEVPPGT